MHVRHLCPYRFLQISAAHNTIVGLVSKVQLITPRAWAGLQVADCAMQVGEGAWVAGIECDVSSPASVQRLMSAAGSQMGSVDVWINNAGNSGTFQVGSICPEKV